MILKLVASKDLPDNFHGKVTQDDINWLKDKAIENLIKMNETRDQKEKVRHFKNYNTFLELWMANRERQLGIK